jgi:prolyl oligopeptidase
MATVNWAPNTYPTTRRSDHVDVYKSELKGDVRVPDPYQWLEDANSKETDEWTSSQERYTRTYLDQIPDRERLENEIRENTDYAKVRGIYVPFSYEND